MNLAKITFSSDLVIEKTGVKDGKPWTIREQEGVLETADRRQPVKLNLGKVGAPFAPGVYSLDLLRNLNVSEFGSIQLKRSLELQPLKA